MRMAGIIGAVLLTVAAGTSAASDPVVARIGDRTFTSGDLTRWIQYGAPEGQDATKVSPKDKAAVLRSIVTAMVIADQARSEQFDQRPDIKESLQLVSNNHLTVQYLDKVVAARVEVSEEEIRQAYEARKEQLLQPEKVRTRQILVRVAGTAPEEERTAALRKAEGIRQRLVAGEDFAKLAAELSDDAGTRTRGGDLGFLPRGKMFPELEDAAFAMKAGTLSAIIKTDEGYHILKVEEKVQSKPQPYEEVRSGLRKKLIIDKKKKSVDAYVEQLVKEKKIEFTPDPLFGSSPHGK